MKKIVPTNLIDLIKDKKNVSELWSDNDNVLYNNVNLFKTYMEVLEQVYNNELENINSNSYDIELIDEDDEVYVETITPELQEVYLGYDIEENVFISLFDMWVGDDNPCGKMIWKINENGSFEILLDEILYNYNMTYGKNGYYTKVILNEVNRKNYIDIRLD